MYVQRMETKLLRFKVVKICYYECHKRCWYIIQLCHIKHTKGLLEAKPEFAVIFAIDADTRQIILPKDIFMVNYWRDNRSKQIVMSQGSCLFQGNSLRVLSTGRVQLGLLVSSVMPGSLHIFISSFFVKTISMCSIFACSVKKIAPRQVRP